MSKKYVILLAVGALIVGAAGGFFGGWKYQAAKRPARANLGANFGQGGAGAFRAGMGMGAGNFMGRGMAAGGITAGQILSKDDKSITVKLADGGSKIVFYSDSTNIGKTAAASSSDLNVGDSVTVTGTANSDGSLTAQRIQIVPQAMPQQ